MAPSTEWESEQTNLPLQGLNVAVRNMCQEFPQVKNHPDKARAWGLHLQAYAQELGLAPVPQKAQRTSKTKVYLLQRIVAQQLYKRYTRR